MNTIRGKYISCFYLVFLYSSCISISIKEIIGFDLFK